MEGASHHADDAAGKTKLDKPFDTTQAYQDRLSLPFSVRLPLAGILVFLGGASLGLAHGGKMAGMRFRAEHAHIFPTTTTGWYFYHKSKNYHIMLGALKEGFKMGTRVSFWVGTFFATEDILDNLRGKKDFVSTAVAGLSVAVGFSAKNRFPLPTTMRTCKTGLYSGFVFGAMQDAIGLARGRRIGYVDFILSQFGRGRQEPETDIPSEVT